MSVVLMEDPVIGFSTAPLEKKSGYRWSLTSLFGLFLTDVQEKFGQRNHDYTPLGIEFCGPNPKIWYPGNGKYISIMLSESAKQQPNRAVFQLAHETVHILSPSGGKRVRVLEEGMATYYAHEISEKFQLHMKTDWSSYLEAEGLIREVINCGPELIREMRKIRPNFNDWDEKFFNASTNGEFKSISGRLCAWFER